MFQNLDVFRMSAAMAQHAGQRQALIAQNMANADTPDYIARDIAPFAETFLQTDRNSTIRATRSSHFNGVGETTEVSADDRRDGQSSPNGNQVSLETEILKSVEAKRQHDRALAIYKSALGVIRATMRSN